MTEPNWDELVGIMKSSMVPSYHTLIRTLHFFLSPETRALVLGSGTSIAVHDLCSHKAQPDEKENEMNVIAKLMVGVVLIAGMSGCADMTTRQKNAAAGAAIGGVAGAVLTGGSSFGTVGGAAIGGVIGHGIDGYSGKR